VLRGCLLDRECFTVTYLPMPTESSQRCLIGHLVLLVAPTSVVSSARFPVRKPKGCKNRSTEGDLPRISVSETLSGC
jgi:hypothetical protein